MMNAAQFKKSLANLKKGQKRFTDIHEAALFALFQINTHGQTTPANQLVAVLHKGDRVDALKTWFHDFGKCKELKDGTIEYVHKRKIFIEGEEATPEEAQAAAESMPYFEYTKEIKPVSSYDVMKGVKSILSRAKAMQRKGLSVEHPELLKTLASLVPAE